MNDIVNNVYEIIHKFHNKRIVVDVPRDRIDEVMIFMKKNGFKWRKALAKQYLEESSGISVATSSDRVSMNVINFNKWFDHKKITVDELINSIRPAKIIW